MATGEDVRVCRFCGHIDSMEYTGQCRHCGLYLGIDIVSRSEAEKVKRRLRLDSWRRRLFRLLMLLILMTAVTLWGLRTFFDLGVNPPGATTRMQAEVSSNTWPQFRRTPENSGFTPAPVPFPHRISWTHHTTVPLASSPVVVGDHIYLMTSDGRAMALHRHTGQPRWTYMVGGPSDSAPAVAEDVAIFATRPGRVVALDRHSGAFRWRADLKGTILSSPILGHGTVYIGSADSQLYALDAASGQKRWTFAAMDWLVKTVAYAGDRVIVATQNSRLYGIGTATGRQRFSYDTGLGRHITTSPVIRGKRAYFGTRRGRLWAVDWQVTTYPWDASLLFWRTNLYVWGMRSSPPIQKGTLWNKKVGGDISHTPAVAYDTVYVGTAQGKLLAIQAETGNIKWTTDLDVETTTAPIVAGKTVLIGTRKGVVGLATLTGEVQWHLPTETAIIAAPIVVGDTMYVASRDGTLYAVVSDK